MADANIGQLPEETVEKIVSLLVKTFVDNQIDKPSSGIAMMVLLNRLKAEGYAFVMIEDATPAGNAH